MVLATYDDYGDPVNSTSPVDRKFWEYFDNPSAPVYDPSAPIYDSSPTVYNFSAKIDEPRDQGPVLATLGVLMAVGGIGNIAVLAALTRTRRRRSRVDLLMTHLAIADVCVTCGVIPLEIGWKYTNAWLVGNLLCKSLLVLRAFGLYLSSNVLVCISIDRFFAVLYPLRLPVARRRSKQMLYCAWAAALACSLPQSVVFRVKRHPYVFEFEQCVSFDAFSSMRQEVLYNVFCLCAMYFVPLIVITVCYVCIFCEIRSSSRELDEKSQQTSNGVSTTVRLRRSDRRVLERARRRTLRMTVTIVAVFALSWLPYATMAMWYMIDRVSAQEVSPRVQDLLFAMAVSNSCMNPLVYGSYTLKLRALWKRILASSSCVSTRQSDTLGTSGSSSVKNRNNNKETPLMTPTKNGRLKPRLGVRFAETSLTAVPDKTDTPTRAPRAPA